MASFNPKIDLSAIAVQFEGLRGRHPGLWPALPRGAWLSFLARSLAVPSATPCAWKAAFR